MPDLTYEQAQELWGEAVKKFGFVVRNFVTARIHAEHKFEELGSSDVNCYAIGYIRSGLLDPTGIPHWTDNWEPSGHRTD